MSGRVLDVEILTDSGLDVVLLDGSSLERPARWEGERGGKERNRGEGERRQPDRPAERVKGERTALMLKASFSESTMSDRWRKLGEGGGKGEGRWWIGPSRGELIELGLSGFRSTCVPNHSLALASTRRRSLHDGYPSQISRQDQQQAQGKGLCQRPRGDGRRRGRAAPGFPQAGQEEKGQGTSPLSRRVIVIEAMS
jgi:hypothetical protein